MTVTDLIARLRQLPPDALVVMAGSPDGSRYGHLGLVSENDQFEDLPLGGGELLDVGTSSPRSVDAVTLWPVN